MKDPRICLLLVLLLSACTPIVREEMYTTRAFEPTVTVEILNTWPKDRKYVAIAKLETSSGENAVNELMSRAKEMGADAIVLGPVHTHGQVLVPLDLDRGGIAGQNAKIQLESIQAIAIKYTP